MTKLNSTKQTTVTYSKGVLLLMFIVEIENCLSIGLSLNEQRPFSPYLFNLKEAVSFFCLSLWQPKRKSLSSLTLTNNSNLSLTIDFFPFCTD